MKNYFFALVVCFSLTAIAFAHPPKDIKAEFNKDTKVLKITIIHNVKDSLKHFIEMNMIGLNSKNIIHQDFLSQLNNNEQDSIYMLIDAKPADQISIEAECNVFGKLVKTFKIADITTKNPQK